MFYSFRKQIFTSLVLCTFIISCTNKKKLIYFQGNLSGSEANKTFNPILRSGDMLSIVVMGIDEQVVKPFNIPITNNNQNIGGYSVGAPSPPGYLIDPEGMVDFPVIGKLKISGLTRTAAIDLLKEQLKPYLNNPTILIRILNFKITVLGDVKNPGTFTIPNERVTLPEALGIAGDLLITGTRKNVMVIRDVEGTKTETIVDLTSKALFSSPVYYLSQNDVVYIEPNRAKINSSVVNASNVSIVVSVVSLLITLAVLITR